MAIRPLIRSRPSVWEDAARLADALGPAARRDLLRVLTSPSEVRADIIRQLHERPDGQEMADLLIFLEEWERARQGMIEELCRAYARDLVRVVGRREGSARSLDALLGDGVDGVLEDLAFFGGP